MSRIKMESGLESKVLRTMQEANVPGIAVSLVREGRLLISDGFGHTGLGTSVTGQTVFEAASLTKPVFSYLVLAMRDKGVLALDTPIATYMPGFAPCDDQRYKMITARNVLCHTGGFQNWRGKDKLAIDSAPGSEFKYSGEGYVYLQKALEHLTGEPLDITLQREIFKPLGLSHSSLTWTYMVQHALSRSHNTSGDAEEGRPMLGANAAYSLYTTQADYMRFLMEFTASDKRLLSPGSTSEMLTPQISLSDRLGWALGWGVVSDQGSHRSYWHWGDNGGFTSYVWFSPVEHSSLLVFTNSANGLIAAHELALALCPEATVPFSDFLCDLYKSPLRL